MGEKKHSTLREDLPAFSFPSAIRNIFESDSKSLSFYREIQEILPSLESLDEKQRKVAFWLNYIC